MSKEKELERNTPETTEPAEASEAKTGAVVNVVGVVSDCKKLNIRKAPNKNADVIKIVAVDEELTIAGHSLGKPWYRVTTADGTKGFCMCEYINVVR